MRKFTFSARAVPALLLLVAILSFGLLLPWLGFYWDDWAKILVARLWGLRAYFAYYAGDRPLSAWTHIVFTPLLGMSPLAWQVFNLLLRWLSALGMFWALNGLWPAARRQNAAAALLFLVYPVFLQQPAAVTFHQQWLQYALFFLSLGAMIYAQKDLPTLPEKEGRRKRSALFILSLLAMLLQLTVTEYFAPLELVRPVVLWILFASRIAAEDRKDQAGWLRDGWLRSLRLPTLWRTLRAWAPYLALTAAYGIWRLFFLRLPGGRDPYRANTLYAFLKNPLGTLKSTAQVALVDELRILVDSWADLLHIQVAGASPFTLLSYAVGLVAGGLVVIFLLRMRETQALPAGVGECPPGWARQALILGVVAVLLGPIPAWITGRQVVYDFHSDRYAMPAMFGAALIFAAAIEWLAQGRAQRALLTGLLIALAVGVQIRAANDYRWIWTSEQRFFWQLSWRAPGLQPQTALFLENEPFPNQGLFSTSAELNLMYPQSAGPAASAGPSGSARLAYWVYTLRPRYQAAPKSFDTALTSTFRTLHFEGRMNDSLLVYNDPSRANCLWVLSARDAHHPYLPDLVRGFLPISNLDRIQPAVSAPGYPPQQMIGGEPEHTWCYYFEKADLARQQQDWAQVARLGDQAKARGYRPDTPGANSPYEWLPFIEGYARAGQWSEAARLTRRASEADAHYIGMLCDLWTNDLPPYAAQEQAKSAVTYTVKFLGCAK